ncbi:RTA1 like protein [Metarhizium acridum]|uniref:RTA1 like protein family n=1 Tax=Metarhizium acridum (strain CQMa 102) TaxID=655827 RepID=E9DV32_METAQ|nr:RTA1 like protein family [Metarhizium acridum CQMa 102]EFY92456.1 RTA1 like protein family [Metarhizium acridum CQMa 102]KAG8424431.1 RTA1 like protein [Metarhizium acridum]KAG8428824.1 RTA1 like protein [Metarhizium acridum]
MSKHLPPGVKTIGPDANCTLDNCPAEWSIYGFRPSLAANATFLGLFILVGLAHGYLGFRWRSWGFMGGMILGCLSEAIGYAGRIMLYNNPFSFVGFMVQIVCLTIAPVFYTASIYVTLSKTIMYFAPDLSRFNPQLFYWIFIPFDVICLILQAAGGAMSSNSNGDDRLGVNVSMAGLALQVVVLTAFVVCFTDYMVRYMRSGRARSFGWRLNAFFLGLASSVLLILARCAYRVAELKDGYNGSLIREETPFIILEGVVIVLAATALCFGHPGLVFPRDEPTKNSHDSEESGTSTPERK